VTSFPLSSSVTSLLLNGAAKIVFVWKDSETAGRFLPKKPTLRLLIFRLWPVCSALGTKRCTVYEIFGDSLGLASAKDLLLAVSIV
jgi:hypothetical protein